MRRISMAKDCLYCGLQFSDTTHFCPNCGRPTESGFSIRPIQESELERLRREMKEKDDLIRQLVLSLRFKSPAATGSSQFHLLS
jgi:predicted amidophosphoribosyltransferase